MNRGVSENFSGPFEAIVNRGLIAIFLSPSLQNIIMFRTPYYFADDVILVTVASPTTAAEWRHEFEDVTRTFPEFNPGASRFNLGSFGGIGCASSFHNGFVRKIRRHIHPFAVNALRKLAQPGEFIQQLLDRMCLRHHPMTYSGETWHRDNSSLPGVTPTDRIFGGIVAIHGDRTFTCVPGSSLPIGAVTGGFGKIDPPPADKTVTITIRPGQMLLFRQNIIHSVSPFKFSKNSPEKNFSIFVGFRLSQSEGSVYGDGVIEDILANQKVPPSPSGELFRTIPRMISSAGLYRSVIPWSNSDVKLDYQEMTYFPKIGLFGYRCPDVMYPLFREDRYPDYSPEEIFIMVPHSIFGVNI